MSAALHELTCGPIAAGHALAPDQWPPMLAQLKGWVVLDGVLQKSFRFSGFHHTMAFVNAVAAIAHAQDHHPEMTVGFGRCTLHWSTHSVAGLSINDFICAAKADALVAGSTAPRPAT